MYPTKPLGRIYVEKTPEQCYLGCRNSQKTWGASNGTNTQVMAFIIKKWKAKINGKQPYNVRDPPEREGLEKSKRERGIL